jgi:hypothetical protein
MTTSTRLGTGSPFTAARRLAIRRILPIVETLIARTRFGCLEADAAVVETNANPVNISVAATMILLPFLRFGDLLKSELEDITLFARNLSISFLLA